MKKSNFYLFVLFFSASLWSQNYSSYFTGNQNDIETNPLGGICLMGGATESDEAMQWFLEKANGGDVLILRASGSDGYNEYLYSDLNVAVNSVETIVFNNASASSESYIHQKIQQAEAIWFAGGDQWNYISYWRNNTIQSLINEAIINRNIVIGGTSAGMAILGQYYFSAENGTVSSSAALSNPYNSSVTADTTPFLNNPLLENVITDTHYDNPDRKGRHLVFLARLISENNVNAKGITCDEYTAVCIETNGTAKVYGDYPSYDDNAYFIQPNCEINNNIPENCVTGNPLNWNFNGEALKVYKVKGTISGSNSFNLSTWEDGTGGNWENWWVDNGVFNELASSEPNCTLSTPEQIKLENEFIIYPNPAKEIINIRTITKVKKVIVLNSLGQKVLELNQVNNENIAINTQKLTNGLYIICIYAKNGQKTTKKITIKK